MLVKIDKADIPMQGGREKSEMRRWAEEAVAAFLRDYRAGECAEATGWPAVDGLDEVRNAARARDAIYDAAFYLPHDGKGSVRDLVKVTRRGARVFLERTVPSEDWRRTAVDAARNEQPGRPCGPWVLTKEMDIVPASAVA